VGKTIGGDKMNNSELIGKLQEANEKLEGKPSKEDRIRALEKELEALKKATSPDPNAVNIKELEVEKLAGHDNLELLFGFGGRLISNLVNLGKVYDQEGPYVREVRREKKEDGTVIVTKSSTEEITPVDEQASQAALAELTGLLKEVVYTINKKRSFWGKIRSLVRK